MSAGYSATRKRLRPEEVPGLFARHNLLPTYHTWGHLSPGDLTEVHLVVAWMVDEAGVREAYVAWLRAAARSHDLPVAFAAKIGADVDYVLGLVVGWAGGRPRACDPYTNTFGEGYRDGRDARAIVIIDHDDTSMRYSDRPKVSR